MNGAVDFLTQTVERLSSFYRMISSAFYLDEWMLYKYHYESRPHGASLRATQNLVRWGQPRVNLLTEFQRHSFT